MRILVTFKIVADLDLLRNKSWTITDNRPEEPDYVKKIINPYDESALELALKLADNFAGKGLISEMHALTLDNKQADIVLKRLLACGFNNAHRVECPLDLQFNSPAVATVIAAYLKHYIMPDLIIMGMQSSDGDNAKTPFLTAEELGWPCISGVTGFSHCDSNLIKIQSAGEQQVIEQTISLPCILAVGNAPSQYLRVPTLKAIKAASDKKIEVSTLDRINLTPEQLIAKNDTELVKLIASENKRAGLIIEGASAEEKAACLYNRYLKRWLSDL